VTAIDVPEAFLASPIGGIAVTFAGLQLARHKVNHDAQMKQSNSLCIEFFGN